MNTLCWKCDNEFDITLPSCPKCGSVNPNVNLKGALEELKKMHKELFE